MTDVANAGDGENASGPAAAKAAPKDPWALPDVSHLVVGVLGGTGDQGRDLAYRLARAGQRVILGSRAADRARRSGIVIAAVPWDGPAEILQSLRADPAGKLVVDCVNPLGLDKQGAYALTVPEGSDEPTTGGHGRARQQAGQRP